MLNEDARTVSPTIFGHAQRMAWGMNPSRHRGGASCDTPMPKTDHWPIRWGGSAHLLDAMPRGFTLWRIGEEA